MQTPPGEVTRLRRLDLNLLVTLDCLIAERGVSKAAKRLSVSQSTASDALARLRRHFGDPLLQGSPRNYELSPFAQRLAPAVAEAVRAADRVFSGLPDFEPASDRAEFRLACTEHAAVFVGARIVRAIERASVGARVLLLPCPPRPDVAALLRDGDGVIASDAEQVAGAARIGLGTDPLVVVVPHGAAPPRSLDDLASREWVVPDGHDGLAYGPYASLTAAGVVPIVGAAVPSMLLAASFVDRAPRATLLPRSVAELQARTVDIDLCVPPGGLAPMSVSMSWPLGRIDDPVHEWLRDVVSLASG